MEYFSANSRSWVMTITPVPLLAMEIRISPMLSRNLESSAEVGSSKQRYSGSMARARPMATRCCC
ncbi:MAG TPA: hypothetical protein DHN33_02770, partial [Eubacteriaceae bacterium]|nr:hypothetical protein [Eubacteriaceae bacterium]